MVLVFTIPPARNCPLTPPRPAARPAPPFIRRSDLVKGYYDSDESGSFSAQSSHRSLVSTVTGGSSTTAR